MKKLSQMSYNELITEREQTYQLINKLLSIKAKNDRYKHIKKIDDELTRRKYCHRKETNNGN